MAAEYWGSVIHGPFLVCTLKKALVEVFREEGENVAFHWLKTINSCIYDRKSFHGIHRYAVRPPKTEDQVRQYIEALHGFVWKQAAAGVRSDPPRWK